MKKEFWIANVSELTVKSKIFDTELDKEYLEYAEPWTFENESDAKEYIRQCLNKKLKNLDEQLNNLVEERKQLVNTILTL